MKVSDAVLSRISCRAFLPDPIPDAVIRSILDISRRAPSGGNLQPWHVYVVKDQQLQALFGNVREKMAETPRGEGAEYRIYPENLAKPYSSRRFQCGEDLYATIGVSRDDKAGRIRQFRRNFEMFGASCGLFVYLDRQMGPPQWADTGMFIQSILLMAREHGLHTCPQEAWAAWHRTVDAYVDAPESLMLFCGIAIGYMDEAAPINKLVTERADVDDFATFVD